MPHLDRQDFIALLDRLADPDDAEALAAARDIARRMQEAGATWDDLLIPEGGDAPPGADDGEDEDEYEDDDAADDDIESAAEGEDGDGRQPSAGSDADLALIDRITAECTVSDETREELRGLKEDIAEGDFTAADRKYLLALHARLSKRKGK